MPPTESLRRRLRLAGETLPNRIAKSAIGEGLADPDGRPTLALATLYDAWARGGAGLLITGAVMLDRRHASRPGDVVMEGAPDAAFAASLAAWAKSARKGGAGVWMQLSHAGRQAWPALNATPSGPSAIPMATGSKALSVALSKEEISALSARFVTAAQAAQDAGFTGVQVQASHGELLSSFLASHTNKRRDAYGGSLENRARWLLEIVHLLRKRVGGQFTISVKINAADFERGGFTSGECLLVAGWLATEGVDVIEISGGTAQAPRMLGRSTAYRPPDWPRAASTAAREAYFLQVAVDMQRSLTVPVMVTGGFRSLDAIVDAVAAEGVALVGLARPFCLDPLVAAKVLAGQPALERWEDRFAPPAPSLFRPRPEPTEEVELAWCRQQVRRMSEGRPPDPMLSAADAIAAERGAQNDWLAIASR